MGHCIVTPLTGDEMEQQMDSPSPAGPSSLPLLFSSSLPLHYSPSHSAPPLSTPTELLLPLVAQAACEQSALIYRLCREVKTIPDLWREWMVGLGGRPSVEELDKH